jgi:flagellin
MQGLAQHIRSLSAIVTVLDGPFARSFKMAQVINTNIYSLNAQRNLMNSQASMQTSLQRLSSGLRINSAKDDAAGLAIAERMTAQIRGVNQAMRNANDGVSMLQTAEGAMDEISNMLQRMRELAVQAANGTVNTADRNSLQDEYAALGEEIDRIVTATEFNGTAVLDGGNTVTFQIGANDVAANDQLAVDFANLGTDLTATDDNISTGAVAAITALDADIDTVAGARADLGAVQSRFESTVRNLANISENLNAARSRIRDADFAAETANLTRTQILQQAGAAMLAQANLVPQNVLTLLR